MAVPELSVVVVVVVPVVPVEDANVLPVVDPVLPVPKRPPVLVCWRRLPDASAPQAWNKDRKRLNWHSLRQGKKNCEGLQRLRT